MTQALSGIVVAARGATCEVPATRATKEPGGGAVLLIPAVREPRELRNASPLGAQTLASMGYANPHVRSGALTSWHRARLPVEREQPPPTNWHPPPKEEP